MGRGPSAQTSSDSAAVLVEERIGTEYENVKIVATNIDSVTAVAENLDAVGELEALLPTITANVTAAQLAETNAEAAQAAAAASQAAAALDAAAADVDAATAVAKAAEANSSAVAAADSATSAANAEIAAETAQAGVAASAAIATTKATEAAASAAAALVSENAAATSASDADADRIAAAASAVAAAASNTSAQSAKTAAELAETNAETAEANAELAETNAETAAGTATAQATIATTKAGEAAASATAAANSATSADTAKTAAQLAETNAETAQAAAELAETNAETAQAAAVAARVAAETAETNAETAATNAAASATAADTSEANAAASAAAAATSEANATAAHADLVGGNTGQLLVKASNADYDYTWAEPASGASISDEAFGAGWNADTTGAASRNAIYDKLITQQGEIDAKVASSLIGAASGIAPLGADSKIAAIYLPSFVDDIIEAADFASLPGTGETGKIYVTLDNNKTFRWSGSAYVEISASPGTTDALTEGVINLYFTEARVLATVGTGLADTAGTPSAVDTILTILGKIKKALFTDLPTSLGLLAPKADPDFTGQVDVNQGNVVNIPCINVTNLGAGTSGITLTNAAGGLMYFGGRTGNQNYAAYSQNRSMVLFSNGESLDTSGYGIGLQASGATRIVAQFKHTTAGATGDYLECVDSTGVVKAKVDSTGAFYTGANRVLTEADKGIANGIAPLDGDGFVPFANMASLFFVDVNVVASQAAQLALTAQEGDVAIRSDINKSFIHNGGTAGTMADWSELLTPTDQVLSVAGLTGAISAAGLIAALGLVKGDVGLGNVDNTSDVNKPVSTAQQTALNAKLDDSQAGTFGLTLLGAADVAAAKASLAYAKGDVGLGSVDNTADSAKPVSTAQQAALDAKAAAFPTISSVSTSFSAAATDNNKHFVASGTSRTLTLGNITAGTAFTVRFTTAWSLACAGGLSKNGAAPGGVTTGSIAANSLITFLHEGAGVWVASGSGLT